MTRKNKIWRISTLVLSILFTAVVATAIILPLVLAVSSGENPVGGISDIEAISGNAQGGVLVGLRNNKVIAMDTHGDTVWEAEMPSAVTSIAADKDYIAAVTQDKTVILLNREGQELTRFECYYTPDHVAISQDHNLVAVSAGMSAMKNNIQLFDLAGNELDTQKIATTCVGLVIEPSSGDVYYATKNGRIYCVGSDAGVLAQTEYEACGLCYDQTVQTFCTVDTQGTVYCFDLQMQLRWSNALGAEAVGISCDIKTNTVCVLMKDNAVYVLQDEGQTSYMLSAPLEAVLITGVGNGRFAVANKTGDAITVDMASVAFENILQRSQKLAAMLLPVAIILLILAITYQSEERWENWKEKVRNLFRILRKHKISYLFLLPTFVLLIVFNYFPAVWAFFIAFTDYLPGVYCKFVGFDNFIGIFQNEYFWAGIGNMLVFLVTDLLKALIPPVLVAEFLIALRSKKMQYWARVLMYIPGILPGLAGLMIWTTGILGMDGLVNVTLEMVGLGHLASDWLGDKSSALSALCFIGFPWIGSYIIMYGALQGVSQSLYDAAKLDGCGWWRRIVSIDIPLISPQLKYIFVTSFIGSIQDFNRVYQTTMGGPGKATYIPSLELYYNITIFKDYGAASAMGILLFIVIFGATLALLRMKTQEEMV